MYVGAHARARYRKKNAFIVSKCHIALALRHLTTF